MYRSELLLGDLCFLSGSSFSPDVSLLLVFLDTSFRRGLLLADLCLPVAPSVESPAYLDDPLGLLSVGFLSSVLSVLVFFAARVRRLGLLLFDRCPLLDLSSFFLSRGLLDLFFRVFSSE